MAVARGLKGISVNRHSLANRFILALLCLLLFVNMSSLIFIYTVENTRNINRIRHQGGVLGQYVAATMFPYLASYDFIGMEVALEKAMYLKEICCITVLASNEVPVVGKYTSEGGPSSEESGKMPLPLAAWQQIDEVNRLRAKGDERIEVSTPIIMADEYLGRVVIGLSLESSRKETRKFLTLLLLVNVLVAIFLGGGVYFFFWKRALQPIQNLMAGAKRVGLGDFEKPIPILHQDEIGQLTSSFNAMMTARKKAEGELQQKRRDWERLFNAVEDVVTIQDNDMRILQANATAGRYLDKDPHELIGKHCYSVFQQRTEPCPHCPILLCLKDHRHHHADIECPVLGKIFHVSAFPILDDTAGEIGIAHISRDISNQKRLEAQYRQAQKMEAIGTLAGGIAHDFNNILTPIFGYAQIIQLDADPDSSLRQHIDQVVRSAILAQELVKQILTFSRERQHKMQKVQLPSIIKESIKLLRASIPKTIAFSTTIDEECAKILADATQIHQIVMNLCTNAYHAMEASGGTLSIVLQQTSLDTITARLRGDLAPGDYLELKISDSGCGMDAATRKRIFEPFFTTKEEGKGTGMGLSVVHGIVKDHGGAISVYSELDSGTTFTVYLPVATTNDLPPAREEDTGEEDDLRGDEHILVVDDEEAIVVLEQRILERNGYRVTTCTDSGCALALFEKDPQDFDLVITDYTMPGITGLELTGLLHNLRSDIAVILCSGYNPSTKGKLHHDNAISSFIWKPINVTKFLQSVRKVLDKKG
jgi:signal transduction histidine kinase/CheY-like chemotaxis protein